MFDVAFVVESQKYNNDRVIYMILDYSVGILTLFYLKNVRG